MLSSTALAEAPDGKGDAIPQWNISITRNGKRPRKNDVAIALRAFGLTNTGEEDNHHPGHARHFWLPIDPSRRVDCECKVTEETVIDPDGYTWTNTREGAGPCRGCEAVKLGLRPLCPIHQSRKGERGS